MTVYAIVDVGYNDLGFVNDAIQTPHIDALRSGGVALSRLYTSKDCAPSRGSIMTGRYPFRFGYYRNPSDEGGVMLNYTMLPGGQRGLLDLSGLCFVRRTATLDDVGRRVPYRIGQASYSDAPPPPP